MPNENLISATVTDEVKTQVLAKLQETRDLLPFLMKLDNHANRGIATIGTEREAMDSTFSAEMAARPELVPSFVKTEELARDRELRADLQEILQRCREVCEVPEDTVHAAGSDVLLAYLSFSSNVKQAADRGVPGSDTLSAITQVPLHSSARGLE